MTKNEEKLIKETQETYKLLLKMMEFNHWLWEESTQDPDMLLWLSTKTAESGIIAEVQDRIAELKIMHS